MKMNINETYATQVCNYRGRRTEFTACGWRPIDNELASISLQRFYDRESSMEA